jgi:type III pantothenate kinase
VIQARGKAARPLSPIVAVDIGNSAVKWMSVAEDGSTPTAQQRISLRDPRWASRLIKAIDQQLGDVVIRFRVASVNSPQLRRLARRFASLGRGEQLQIIGREHCPMTTRLPHPERLGIDRLLAAWKASRWSPHQACVVIDAGSAITVDCVSPQGVFLGGAILPGVALQFESLGRGTDALPTLDHTLSVDDPACGVAVPATDTDSAIRAGVWLGTAAAIDGLIRQSIHAMQPPMTDEGQPPIAAKRQDANAGKTVARAKTAAKGNGSPDRGCQVFLTGGDSGRLSPLLSHPHRRHDNLVLEALMDEAIWIDRRQPRE